MHVLTFNSHEPFVYDMARIGAPIDVVVDLPGHHLRAWDARLRPVPPNVRLVTLRDVLAAPPRYDAIVAHNLTDLLAIKTLPGARVLVLHTSLRGRVAQERSASRPEDVAAAVLRYLALVRGTLVAVSEMKRAAWGVPCPVLPFAVDPDDYGGYTGEEPSGLRVANHVTAKARYLRWELHEEIFRDLPCRLVGVNPDRPGVTASASWEDLKALYRRHRFYVHTATPGLEDGYNMSVVEAMATGMPVVTSAHPTTPIEDGVSGIVSDDPDALRAGVRRLLADEGLAARMGAAARAAVATRFPMRAFVEGWRALLADAVARGG